MKMTELMTPEHPLWEEFIDQFGNCVLVEDEKGNILSQCKGGTDKSHATAILKMMPGIDIEGSLDYFEAHGGYCDCEILLNVALPYI
jgi:hypothetical protein